jgi:cytochrome c-type biogenesis protein CcmH/NrfG
MNDGWLHRHRARAWLELGQICDLDGRGEAAAKAYRRALEEAPGCADGDAVRVDAEEALRRQRSNDGT